MIYFQRASLERVRAPQIRIPLPGKARMTFTPRGFKTSCSPLVTWNSRPAAPRNLIGRGLVDPPFRIAARIDPCHMPTGWNETVKPGLRVNHLDPWVIKGGILAVIAAPRIQSGDIGSTLGGIADREAVLQFLAV